MLKRIRQFFRERRRAITLDGLEEELRVHWRVAEERAKDSLHSGNLELNFPRGGFITLRLYLEGKVALTGSAIPEELEPLLGFVMASGQRMIFDFRWRMALTGSELHPGHDLPPIPLDE